MPQFKKMNFRGDPNLGLFASNNEDICLMGQTSTKREIEAVEDVLEVEIKKTSIAGSNLIGIFSVMNENGIVVPKNINDEEIENLKELDLNIYIARDIDETAIGNLILVNDKGCIISERLEDIKGDLEECFGVKVEVGKIAEMSIVGSCGIVTNNGLLVHRNCFEEEMKHLEDVLEVEGNIGTANFGSPFVGACLLSNTKGVIVSNQTTGPEMGRIAESLKFT
ncbi:MAG: translation initiation factor IF-6 [Candidatus Aenigmatarchaeota archaeon]